MRTSSLACVLSLVSIAACSRPAPEPRASYGGVMSDVGRRFELAGKAAASGRFELAAYEAGEIGEAFAEALPHAAPPREGHPEVLPAMQQSFAKVTLPALDRAVRAKDRAAAAAAFADTAKACNACHEAAGHGFIEVPTEMGRPVPSSDPR